MQDAFCVAVSSNILTIYIQDGGVSGVQVGRRAATAA